MGAGQPTKYDPKKNKDVIDLMAEGASIIEVAGLLGVTRATVYNWIDENHDSFQQEFFDTIKEGLTMSQLWWEKQGRKNLSNKNFNFTGWMMNMSNRFRQDWKNKQSIEHSTEEDKPIQFEQIVLSRPDKKTD